MNNLSPEMKQALVAVYKHPNFWVSAYDIQCRTTTLDALTDRNMLRRRNLPGYIANPRVNIIYALTDLGRTTAEKLSA